MKTFIEKCWDYIGWISNPASGWFPKKNIASRHRSEEKRVSVVISSPESFQVRSLGRKQHAERHRP
jgi:hypothetical protein